MKDLPLSARLNTFFCPPGLTDGAMAARAATQGPRASGERSLCWRIWKNRRDFIRLSSANMAEFDAKISQCLKKPKTPQTAPGQVGDASAVSADPVHASDPADVATSKPQTAARARARSFLDPVWYRLQIAIGEIVWIFPAIDRQTPRFDGVKRQTPGFRISPFEPPVVPIAGDYQTSFFDAQGNPVDVPKGCFEFFLEPVLPLGVETGTILRDFRKKKE
jgi:hypothetical protein